MVGKVVADIAFVNFLLLSSLGWSMLRQQLHIRERQVFGGARHCLLAYE